MAVTVTNNLTAETNADADATTGWTTSQTDSLYTTFEREASGCLGLGANSSDEDAYITITSADFSSRTLFGWMLNGSPGTEANIGFGILIGDGSNDRVYAVGGSDNYGHFVNGWSGFRLDCANLPATHRNITGTGAPTLTTITRIGYGMNYAIGAFGKVDNVFWDMLRWIANGSAALSIAGGTTGDRGTWAEIKDDDESTADGKAYGVCRLLTAGSKAYELTFGIEFGAATGDTYFDDEGFQVIIAGTGMTAGNMDVDLVAGTGTNLFRLTDGVVVGVGTVSNWDLSAAFETMELTRCSFTDLGTMTFPVTGGTLRQAIDCVWNNCGQIYFSTMTADGCTFNGTTDANGAILWDGSSNEEAQDNIRFNSDGTGHAIEISLATASLTTFNIDGYVFDGYAGQTGTAGNRVFLIDNSSDGDVTINLSNSSAINVVGGGAGFSYESAVGYTGTVTINSTVTLTVTVKDPDGTAIEGARVRIENASTGAEISQGSTNASGVYTDGSYNYGGDLAVTTKVRLKGWKNFRTGGTITGNGIDVGVTLAPDTIVDLP